MHSVRILKLCTLFMFLTDAISCEKGSTWAVLHVGWEDYPFSYAMEAAVYRMYNILVRNNIPRSRIITISPDSAAYHPQNPLQGVLVHATSGNPYTAKNQYEDIEIDYHPKDLSLDLFFEILNGNEVALRNVTGSGKVLKTGPHDRVFVFTTSLGSYGALMLGPNEIFYANTFVPRLEKLKDEKRFAKVHTQFKSIDIPENLINIRILLTSNDPSTHHSLIGILTSEPINSYKFLIGMLMVVDTDNPGSMFDDYLDPSKNIIVYTTGGRYTSLNMLEKNKLVKAYTGTLGSKIFLKSLEQLGATNNESTIFDLLTLARNEALTNTDPANLYGALRLGKEKISDFVGVTPWEDTDFSDEIEVIEEPIKSRSEGQKLHEAFDESGIVRETEIEMLKNRLTLILSKSLEGSQYSVENLETTKPKLSFDEYDCYKNALEAVHDSCFSKKNQVIILARAAKLASICGFGIESQKIVRIAREVCG